MKKSEFGELLEKYCPKNIMHKKSYKLEYFSYIKFSINIKFLKAALAMGRGR